MLGGIKWIFVCRTRQVSESASQLASQPAEPEPYHAFARERFSIFKSILDTILECVWCAARSGQNFGTEAKHRIDRSIVVGNLEDIQGILCK